MISFTGIAAVPAVALLTEGVDRNVGQSPEDYTGYKVALLTEGVDRNHPWLWLVEVCPSRPPHGGRG